MLPLGGAGGVTRDESESDQLLYSILDGFFL